MSITPAIIGRGSRVKWLSRFNESHWFTGVVVRIVPADFDAGRPDIAIVDDDTGLAYRCIPTWKLMVIP